jgi:hypothetical protein
MASDRAKIAALKARAFLTHWEYRMAVLGDEGVIRKISYYVDGEKVDVALTVEDLRVLVEAVLNPDG